MNKEKVYLNKILESEKSLSNCYNIFLNESSNDFLYENIFSMLEDTLDMAREIYNFIYSRNPYNVLEVEKEKIEKEISVLHNLL